MNLSNSIISDDVFFSHGLTKLLGRDFIDEFFLIIDFDSYRMDRLQEIVNTKKTLVAFLSRDSSFYKLGLLENIKLLDKKSSTKEILNYFITNKVQRNYHVKFKLSRRERQMLHMFFNGEGVSFIAEELGLSVKTIYAHRRNMMNKLGCKNRIDLYKLCLNNSCFSNLIK